MRNNFKRFVTLIIIMLMVISIPVSVSAGTKFESYEIKNYYKEITVNKDHAYDIKAKMTFTLPPNFSDLRLALPTGGFRIENIYCSAKDYYVDNTSEGRYIVIPNYGEEKESTKALTLSYRIEEYAERNDSSDMFYLDVISPNWRVPINNLEINLTLPEDFDWSDLQYYAGQFGAQDVNDRLDVKVNGNVVTMTGSKLPANFGITFKAELPNGYWDKELDNTWASMASILLAVFILGLTFLMWVVGGKDPKVKRRMIKHPIDGILPADIGFLLYGRTRIKDVTTLLVYLAIKGYLRIVEYQPKRYKFVKLEEPKDEERYIRNAYDVLFEGIYDGRAIEMQDIGMRLAIIRSKLESSIASGYSASDMRPTTRLSQILRIISMVLLAIGTGSVLIFADLYVYKTPVIYQALIVILVAFVVIAVINWFFDNRFELEDSIYRFGMMVSGGAYIILLGYATNVMYKATESMVYGIAIIVMYVATLFFTLFMKARGKANAQLAADVQGMRDFMLKAKPDDLAPLNRENPDYYYEMLPYALQFSISEDWAKKFKWIKVPQSNHFFSDEISGNAMTTLMDHRNVETVARDIKTFFRTIDSEYRAMNRKRRFF